jgi:hypothetical protein
VGLASEGVTGNNLMHDDGDDISDIDFVGFFARDDDGDTVDFIYQKTGQAFVTTIDAADTLVAATWVKLGFFYDPDADTANRIKIFVNGAEQTTYVTGTNIAAATFPDGEHLSPLIAAKQGTNVDQYFECDWIRVAQER